MLDTVTLYLKCKKVAFSRLIYTHRYFSIDSLRFCDLIQIGASNIGRSQKFVDYVRSVISKWKPGEGTTVHN